MNTAFKRTIVSTVCMAALIAGLSAPAFSSSSIEINLDVLDKSKKPSAEAPKPAAVKPAATPAKKPTPEKAEKPKKETVKKAEPAKAPESKPEKKPAKAPEKPVSIAPVAPPAAAPVAPAAPVTGNIKPEVPPIKDLPPELSPTPPELPATAPELPAPKTAEPSTTPPALPTTTPPAAETPATPPELPKDAAPTAPAEAPAPAKPSLSDQLSDFISGKPSEDLPTPPALPPIEPLAPKGEEPAKPTLPAPATGAVPAPTEMGSPLPDASLTTTTPPAPPAEKSAAPALPKDASAPKEPLAPMGVETPPALPALTPAPPPEEKPATEKAPELPEPAKPEEPKTSATPELPEPAKKEAPSLPALDAITGGDAKPAAPAGKSELKLPDGSSIDPEKTADIPDLVPLPEDSTENIPTLPSGNQEDLLKSPQPSGSNSKAFMEELSKKAGSNDPDMRLIFGESETDVSPSLYGQLDTVAAKLAQATNTRVNILSYAGGKNESGIYPKRISLARGIAVRNYLTSTKGIDIERVNVRALGNKSEGAAPDRVDIFIVK